MDKQDKRQESPNYQRYKDHKGPIDGYPFNEGFPTGGPFGNFNRFYELIIRTGERKQAEIDYSRQYYSEGRQWVTTDRITFDSCVVAAWRELKQ